MKYLIMCEGTDELSIINILLDKDMLKIKRDELLGLTPYHARQINNNPTLKTALGMYTGNDDIEILRIGDTQTDELKIPKEFKGKLSEERIKKYCTKPELEILFIISEGLHKEFQKVKSKEKASNFAKKNIAYNGKKYNKKVEFYKEYFEDRPELLANVLKEYKCLNSSHNKDELYLCDLLK